MGPKKGKKTKAELEEEKLAREEEERKAKIAEDKKNAEDAEKRRLEHLHIESEHKNAREQELQRLQEEFEAITDELKSKELQLQAEEKREVKLRNSTFVSAGIMTVHFCFTKTQNARIEWLRYTDPTDEPDASVESDMNTFISLTRDTFVEDMKPTIALIKRIELISRAVESVWGESLATRNVVVRNQALNNLVTLRDIMLEKLDVATVKLLSFSDDHLNDRSEMNIEETAYKLSMGMWASYADVRPIRKSVIFESMGIQIDLQKQLLQQHDNYVFRVIRMPIVAYNMEAYDISPEVVADIMATREPAPVPVLDEDGVPTSRVVTPRASPRTADIKLPSKYVVGDLILFDVLHAPQPAFHLRVRKWTMRNKSATATKLRKAAYPSSVPSRVQLKVPQDVLMTDDMRVAVWNEEQKDWTEDGISDYQYSESTRTVHFYITTVGVLALVKKRVVDMPYKRWNLAPVLSKPINALIAAKLNITDPSALVEVIQVTEAVAAPADDLADHSVADDRSQGNNTARSAVSVMPSQVTVAAATVPENSFEQYARLTIATQGHEIVIDIVGSLCKLVKPVSPVFTDLLNVPMNPGTLLRKLQRKGINLLPNAADLAVAERVTMKDAVLEDNLLLQVARGASAFEFSSSSWNQSLNESQGGVLVRESNVYTCFPQFNEFECVYVEMDVVSKSYLNTPELGIAPGPGGLKYTLVNGYEYGKRKIFSPVPRPGEIPHLDLFRPLEKRATWDAQERTKGINQRFQKTVHTLLSLVKPYSLS